MCEATVQLAYLDCCVKRQRPASLKQITVTSGLWGRRITDLSSSLSSLASLVPGQLLGLCCSHETLFGALEPDRRLGPFFRVFLGLDLGLKLSQCGAPKASAIVPDSPVWAGAAPRGSG